MGYARQATNIHSVFQSKQPLLLKLAPVPELERVESCITPSTDGYFLKKVIKHLVSCLNMTSFKSASLNVRDLGKVMHGQC